ncbi:protein kinase, partial [Candidatus Margulisiibacteriota bacterium]
DTLLTSSKLKPSTIVEILKALYISCDNYQSKLMRILKTSLKNKNLSEKDIRKNRDTIKQEILGKLKTYNSQNNNSLKKSETDLSKDYKLGLAFANTNVINNLISKVKIDSKKLKLLILHQAYLTGLHEKFIDIDDKEHTMDLDQISNLKSETLIKTYISKLREEIDSKKYVFSLDVQKQIQQALIRQAVKIKAYNWVKALLNMKMRFMPFVIVDGFDKLNIKPGKKFFGQKGAQGGVVKYKDKKRWKKPNLKNKKLAKENNYYFEQMKKQNMCQKTLKNIKIAKIEQNQQFFRHQNIGKGYGFNGNKIILKLYGPDMKTESEKNVQKSLKDRCTDKIGILSGMKHMHDSGYVHLDLKPGNIVFTKKVGVKGRKPKIIDFGCTTKISELVNIGKRGTDGYIAPEIIGNDNKKGKEADYYSFGILCLEDFLNDKEFRKEFLKVTTGKLNSNDIKLDDGIIPSNNKTKIVKALRGLKIKQKENSTVIYKIICRIAKLLSKKPENRGTIKEHINAFNIYSKGNEKKKIKKIKLDDTTVINKTEGNLLHDKTTYSDDEKEKVIINIKDKK